MKLKEFNELGKKWCVNIYKLELCFDIQFDIKQIDSICSLFKIREGVAVHALGVTIGLGWSWK